MSHPIPGHDYSERHNEESSKEYKQRKSKTLKQVASKMKTKKPSMGDSLMNPHPNSPLGKLKRLTGQ